MTIIAQYNAKNDTVVAGGVYLTGFGEDKISFEPNESKFEYAVGADGDVIINHSNDKTATCTLVLQATSPSLKHMYKLEKSGEFFPFYVYSNRNGMKEKAGGSKALVLQKPAVELGKEAGDREFEIVVFDYDNVID